MAKGRKTGGRRPGSVNKTTATTKEALTQAFQSLGGVNSLVAWGKENQTEFYKLWAKLLPQEITGKDGEPIKMALVTWKFGDREVTF
jgi:hypothetical protein